MHFFGKAVNGRFGGSVIIAKWQVEWKFGRMASPYVERDDSVWIVVLGRDGVHGGFCYSDIFQTEILRPR